MSDDFDDVLMILKDWDDAAESYDRHTTKDLSIHSE
jgi:hypothetical protein